MAVSRRRRTGWTEGPFSNVTSLTAAGAFPWSTGQIVLEDGLTLVRTRGEYTLSLDLVTNPGDGFASAAVGICAVSENAAGIGVTAIPAPLTDIDWDGWLFHRVHGAIIGQSTSEVQSTFNSFRIEIDGKAMRKLRATDVLTGMFELGTEIGTASMHVSARSRMLFKLP